MNNRRHEHKTHFLLQKIVRPFYLMELQTAIPQCPNFQPPYGGAAVAKADRLSASWTNDREKLVLSNLSFEVNKVSW